MNILDQAQNFAGGPVAAARKRDSWARREANATDDEQREQYREAIADLEARYPDIADVPVGGAEAFARERGHGTGVRSPVHGGRSRQRPVTRKSKGGAKPAQKKRTPARKPVPGLDPTAKRSSSPRRAAKGRPTPRVDRAVRETGIPAAASSTGGLAMSALGATVGMGLLYAALRESPGAHDTYSGPQAIDSVVQSVVRFVGRILSPTEDILGPAKAAPAASTGRASRAELNRVERGSHGIPGEVGTSGIAAGDLANPGVELKPHRRVGRSRLGQMHR